MTAGMIAVPTIMPLKEPGSILAGSRKWMIDTNTLVDLHTTSKDCLLFYTVDGTKPDPFKKMGNKTTHKFLNPFNLRSGKRTVKALAVLKDGSKESNTNTKVFQVDKAEAKSDDEEVNKNNTSWTTQNTSDKEEESVKENKLFKSVLRDSPSRKVEKEATKNDIIRKVLTDSPIPPSHTPSRDPDIDDSLRCIHCNTERPRDPFARFCNGCGIGLPPAPGGIRTSHYFNANLTCDNCGYEKATESSFCRVCDSITKFNKPSKQRINCKNCDSMNPISVENCLVCDEALENQFLQNNMVTRSIVHKPCSDFIQCPFCERINSGDARYCDWCSKEPQTAPVTFSCQRCKADNSLYSEYCCSCGDVLETPMRKSFKDNLDKGEFIIENGNDESFGGNKKGNSKNTPWKKMKLQKIPKRPSRNISTQAGENLVSNMSLSKSKSNPLFNFSPGKGYWRQQIDHICHHLKVYTQNNLEFRESVANYVMSRMISAIVEESEDLELVLTAKFALKDQTKKAKGMKGTASALNFISTLTTNMKTKDRNRESIGSISKSVSVSRPTSARSPRSRPGSARSRPSSARSRTSSTGSRPGTGKRKKKTQKSFEKIEKEKVTAKLSKLSTANLKVLNMIKSMKVIDEEKVDELLKSEEFDPNTNDENDIPILKLSVVNKRFQFIPLLIEAGADVNKISGTKMTSALHEAVLLGINGRDAVSALIENGASVDVKDKKGLSAFDLAVESGIDSLIEKFTKLTSKQMLDDVKL